MLDVTLDLYVIQWHSYQCWMNQLHLTFSTKAGEYKSEVNCIFYQSIGIRCCLPRNQLDPVRHY